MSKLYDEIYKMKNILRRGWVLGHVGNAETGRIESDGEHTFSMCMLAMEIMAKCDKYKGLDQLKVYKMILVHEICEVDVGDITTFDNVSKEEKYRLELACVERIAKECDMPEMLDLWKEFKDNKTAEAQFVTKMDRLDAIVQAKIYSNEKKDNALFKDFRNNYKSIAEEFKKFL